LIPLRSSCLPAPIPTAGGAGRQVRLCGEPVFESSDQKKSAKEEE